MGTVQGWWWLVAAAAPFAYAATPSRDFLYTPRAQSIRLSSFPLFQPPTPNADHATTQPRNHATGHVKVSKAAFRAYLDGKGTIAQAELEKIEDILSKVDDWSIDLFELSDLTAGTATST